MLFVFRSLFAALIVFYIVLVFLLGDLLSVNWIIVFVGLIELKLILWVILLSQRGPLTGIRALG